MSVSRPRGANLHLTIAVLTAIFILLFPAFLGFSQTLSLASGTSTLSPGTTWDSPSYVVADATDTLYVADTLNNCVRRLDATGSASVVAGVLDATGAEVCSSQPPATAAAGLAHPLGLAIDSLNRLYIADSLHGCIRMLAPGTTGVRSLRAVAGNCTGVSALQSPTALAIDGNDTLYIATSDPSGAAASQVIRQSLRQPAGICVLAGQLADGSAPACGPASIALSHPSGLTIAIDGSLLIADTGDDCIRRVSSPTTASAALTTIAGYCSNDGSGTGQLALHAPLGLAITRTGLLLVSEAVPDLVLQIRLSDDLAVPVESVPVAGVSAGITAQDQNGAPATSIALRTPKGLAVDSQDRILVADSGNNVLRRVATNQIFLQATIAASSAVLPITLTKSPDARLSLTSASDFSILSENCSTAAGSTCQAMIHFVPSHPGLRQGQLKAVDTVSGSTLAVGLSGLGMGSLPLFLPGTLSSTTPLTGTSVMALAPDGSIIATEVTGNSYQLHRLQNGGDQLVSSTSFPSPSAIAISAAGDLFVADTTRGTVTRIGADGTVNPGFLTGLDTPRALALDSFGNLFVAEAGLTHMVTKIFAAGSRQIIAGAGTQAAADGIPASAAAFVTPSALTLSNSGILYIADAGAHAVYSVETAGVIHLIAGGSNSQSGLITPAALATDAAGDLYIADSTQNAVYVLYPYAGLANNLELAIGAESAGLPIALNSPTSLAVTATGDLMILDGSDHLLRLVTRAAATLSFPATASGSALTQRLLNAGTDTALLASSLVPSDPHFTATGTSCSSTLRSGALCDVSFAYAPSSSAVTATTALTQDGLTVLQLAGAGNQLQTLQLLLPAAGEIYGQPFSMLAAFTNINDGPTPTGTFTFSASGKPLCTWNGPALGGTILCNAAPSALSAGSYPATFSYSGDGTYAPLTGRFTLTISRARLSIVVNNASRVYGAPNPAFTGQISGAAAGDTLLVSYTTTAAANSPIGTYSVRATLTSAGGNGLANYLVSASTGELSILPATLTVQANNAARTYGAPNPALTGSIAGLAPGDQLNLTYTTSASAVSLPGSYPILASLSGQPSANYTIKLLNGTLAVEAASTLTALAGSDAADGSGTTLAATVSSAVGTPSGSVIFADGATALGTQPLDTNGRATLPVGILTSGRHSFTAAFTGNAVFTASNAQMVRLIAMPAGSFSLAVSSAPQILHGTTTSLPVTISSVNGFSGAVALHCDGLPAGATCSFAKEQVTLAKGGSVTTTMTVVMPAASASARIPASGPAASAVPLAAAVFFPFELTGLGACCAGAGRNRSCRISRRRLWIVLLFGIGLAGMTGCGATTTALQTYTVNVTANSVQAPTDLQTAAITLAVMPAR